MRIKNQERIMAAILLVLEAEDLLAAVHATKRPKRESQKAANNWLKSLASAENRLATVRAELRRAFFEVRKEEYGG